MAKKDKDKAVLRVKSIKNGVVIDHIKHGKAPEVLRILGIDEEFRDTVTLALNVSSSVHGKKDIVKVENRDLSTSELNQIAVISPNATINKIKNHKVVEKKKVKLPKQIIGAMRCPNPQCISNKKREHVKPTLLVKQSNPLILKCKYCERNFP